MKWVKTIFILLALTLWGISGAELHAQEGSDHDVLEADQAGQGDWLDLWVRVQKIRLDRMQAELQVDRKTMDALAPKLNQIDEKKRAIGKERLSLLRTLKQRSKANASEAVLGEILKQIEENDAALERLKEETKALIKTHLTPEQQAKYLLFQRRFKEELRDILQKERRHRMENRRRP